MKLSDFDYELPPERIAQCPVQRRDRAGLMVLAGGKLQHGRFDDLADLLKADDLLVLNDTRVLPARLLGHKATGGRVELLLLEPVGEVGGADWYAWIRASRPPQAGSTLVLGGRLRATVLGRQDERWRVRLDAGPGCLEDEIERHGRMPLPPYIHRDAGSSPVDDNERYQTVYARRPGAVAAPTAGLHFTNELLDRVRARGVVLSTLTLHVGLGTFQPVRAERVEEHRIHAEWMDLPEQTVEAVERTRRRGGAVVAVGTTVVRALESRATASGIPTPGPGVCDLFIRPGFEFRVVDAMITNFHLPRSTLLMLVAAFAGRERLLRAYDEAVARGYRFYSYGDAMFVRPE